MPGRSIHPPIPRHSHRLFHTSTTQLTRIHPHSHNHYETLNISTNATPKEVKASFYKLSKEHHPDRNPNDPEASSKFVKISEAYGVLSIPAKRALYDKEILASQDTHHARTHRGSYHSSGPAGGRPATGLSKRRTHFQGPPPSFYRSGGWGAHSAKRQAAHEGSTASNANSTPGSGSNQYAGMGPGQNPFGDEQDVPHFDREGHLRTHEKHAQRKQRRATQDYLDPPTSGILVNFLFVGGIISLGIAIPSFLLWK
ncbi:hypothetical protein F5884DRAFT_766797 [Xylogone sp. PMI_703]|nr:hypothetical protein F5884DRAFT_766797 [Xylogone sp. PMI_703]